jgi:hypothetical protein
LHSDGRKFVTDCLSSQDEGCGFDTENYLTDPRTRIVSGDFNGDQKTDLLVFSGQSSFPRRRLYFSNGHGFSTQCSSNVDEGCGFDIEPYITDPKTWILKGNFDGDSKKLDDILIISGQRNFPRRRLHLSTGSEFQTDCVGNTDGACGFDTEPYMFHPKTLALTGDFEGNGKTDVLILSGDASFNRQQLLSYNTATHLFGAKCIGFGQAGCGINYDPNISFGSNRFYVGSFDNQPGDDILQLFVTGGRVQQRIYSFRNRRFIVICDSAAGVSCGLDLPLASFQATSRLIVADINGDGLLDLVDIEGSTKMVGERAIFLNRNGQFSKVCGDSVDGACGFDTEDYMNDAKTKMIAHNFDQDASAEILIISGTTFRRSALLKFDPKTNKFEVLCVGQTEECGIPTDSFITDYHSRIFPEDTASPQGMTLASQFLGGPQNIAEFLQFAANSGTSELIFNQVPGNQYMTGSFSLGSHLKMTLESGINLMAAAGLSQSEPLITAKLQSDIRIQGGVNSTINMPKSEYTGGEWRHVLSLLSSRDVTIQNVALNDSGGDGLYLGDAEVGVLTPDAVHTNSNIVVDHVTFSNNSRNGLSVISVDGLTITNSVFSNTNTNGLTAPHGPWAGVDFEPNHPYETLKNITMSHNKFVGNRGAGILFAVGALDATGGSIVSANFDHNTVDSNGRGVQILAPASNSPNGQISFSNDNIEKSKGPSVCIIDKSSEKINVVFNSTMIQFDHTDSQFDTAFAQAPIIVSKKTSGDNSGGISFKALKLQNITAPNALAILNTTTSFVEAISGNITTTGSTSILQSGPVRNISVQVGR